MGERYHARILSRTGSDSPKSFVGNRHFRVSCTQGKPRQDASAPRPAPGDVVSNRLRIDRRPVRGRGRRSIDPGARSVHSQIVNMVGAIVARPAGSPSWLPRSRPGPGPDRVAGNGRDSRARRLGRPRLQARVSCERAGHGRLTGRSQAGGARRRATGQGRSAKGRVSKTWDGATFRRAGQLARREHQ